MTELGEIFGANSPIPNTVVKQVAPHLDAIWRDPEKQVWLRVAHEGTGVLINAEPLRFMERAGRSSYGTSRRSAAALFFALDLTKPTPGRDDVNENLSFYTSSGSSPTTRAVRNTVRAFIRARTCPPRSRFPQDIVTDRELFDAYVT
jgi:hypothetical protein